MGGVGGVYLTTLARLGFGQFSIADFDRYELANFNRQVGARMSTLGQTKIDVMREMALDINPELEIRAFPDGVREQDLTSFSKAPTSTSTRSTFLRSTCAARPTRAAASLAFRRCARCRRAWAWRCSFS